MTIALGILATDGVVLAADTQETYSGVFKLSQGKILAAMGARRGLERIGGFAVTGAGTAAHIDSLSQELCDHYLNNRRKEDGAALESSVKGLVAKFFNAHIVPCAVFPEHDRPAVSLVIGFQRGKERCLWATEKSAARQMHYAAVGIGEAHANHLLSQLWTPGISTAQAIVLAAYVLFWVKRHVDGCGIESQIAILQDDFTLALAEHTIEQLEEQFEILSEAEDRMLQYALGFQIYDANDELREITEMLRVRRGASEDFMTTGWKKGGLSIARGRRHRRIAGFSSNKAKQKGRK